MVSIAEVSLSFDQTVTIIGLVVNIIQALVLPITIYLLVVQTRAMRIQTAALVEQSKEMTAQTRVFIDTIYSTTFQGLYDAEAHIGELMMAYPDAARILMSPVPKPAPGQSEATTSAVLQSADQTLRERVRWLGTAILDFFEHIWTQAKNKGLPPEVWEAWEDYMCKMLGETHLRFLWQTERNYYDPGFRHFIDTQIGLATQTPPMPTSPPRPPTHPTAERPITEASQPQVARVLRAVTDDKHQ